MHTALLRPGHRGPPPPDGEAGEEVGPAEPQQPGAGQRARQGLDPDGAGHGGDEEHGHQRHHGHRQRRQLVGHSRPDQAHSGLQQDILHFSTGGYHQTILKCNNIVMFLDLQSVGSADIGPS